MRQKQATMTKRAQSDGQTITCTNCSQEYAYSMDVISKTPNTPKLGFTQIGLVCPHCKAFRHLYYDTIQLTQARANLNNARRRVARKQGNWLADRFKARLEDQEARFKALYDEVQEEALRIRSSEIIVLPEDISNEDFEKAKIEYKKRFDKRFDNNGVDSEPET